MNPQPPPTADRLFAPNVYVFAYTLVDGSENKPNTNPLWEYGDKIFGYFTDEKITDNLDVSFSNDSKSDRIYLISDNARYFTSAKYPGIEGFAQPQKIKDSYALWLNVGYSDEDETAETVAVADLKQFNRNHALSLPQADKFIGQTLLITAWLTTKTQQRDKKYLRNLANQCCQSLLGENAPPFDRAGELFDSAIFAYGKPSQPTEYPHVLVWLFRDEKADRQYGEYQQELILLFLYRSKIVKAFQNSRLVYNYLDKAYRHLEDNLDRLQLELLNNPLDVVTNDDYLEDFKTQLKTFAKESLPYTRFLRKMEAFHNTIEINIYNYNQIIEQICATIEDDKKELYFLREFGKETAPRFCGQIKADLGYFQHGTDLINTAIASIRGIVEIDQAEAEQKLQDHIQSIGVGIAAGAIVASTSGLIFAEQITYPWQENRGKDLHPFTIAVLLSVACAVGFWWVCFVILKCRRK